ncbi:FAD:protein FMN transferase [Salegentibacter mishustinae]|uniref:FAD:protein FMN transferase n=1 Tax=Salegentibacter mishustinae TaxID=270918 RepID=A0A0Q9ZMR1_9FLAO|nr:FAD:protein FMN transferase [Salegentibacter mishustinae]KRG30606.1 thiamine biosynthesis protein ApbE [Salegentibacter mishustinae]PNW23495.1 thiamine biosynthesis protein ApbE [Salegentibacter mishustinae]PZX66571.1 thiamine biosynthesis lipoprotein [Salegentibacter mishustinae]GGW83255.1 FAD:protein FMN transferase [Salegentibacter mishustinae]
MKKITALFFLVLLSVSCKNDGPQANTYTGNALGTTYQVKYFSSENFNTEKALDSIFYVINTSMSTYQDNSDISRINSGAEEVEVDVHFQNVFRYSNQIFRESNGYFDPTVGSLVNAYGFGPDKPLNEPDEAVLDSIRQLVGFEKVKLTADNTIQKENPNIYLDFNAIAKGYTIDVIADYLDKQNVENYLIELGGELVAKGQNLERESPWMVAIDNPQQTDAERTLQTVLALKNRAMATSGNYRKFRIDSITGNRYVHTINPLNGKAEKSNLLSASVLAENCTLADGYATAFMALGYERSLEMLEELENVDVYFIYVDEAESIRIFTSNGFEEALVED